MRVRLAPGVEPERAIAEIKQLGGARSTAVRTVGFADKKREDYVRWATDAEAHLASVLHRKDAQAFFNSPRHRDICSMPPGNQLTTLIYAEVEAITHDIQDAVDYLEGHRRRMRAACGLPVGGCAPLRESCCRGSTACFRAVIRGRSG